MAVARVLILDDEPLIAMLLHDWDYFSGQPRFAYLRRSMREIERIWITQLERGKEAGLFRADLDVSLHKTDCYPVADVLKARNIPFAFGTGRDEQLIALRHAGTPILTKPYDLSALREVMGKLLS